jgi:hypothetical protein
VRYTTQLACCLRPFHARCSDSSTWCSVSTLIAGVRPLVVSNLSIGDAYLVRHDKLQVIGAINVARCAIRASLQTKYAML